jgi:tetratricopeptide (TPR) repeat protein
MKRILLIALSTALSGAVMGQSSMDLTNAILQNKESLQAPKEIIRAKVSIDRASKVAKVNNTVKYYSTRADIYANIARSQDPEIGKVGGDSAGLVAVDNYVKVFQLEKDNKKSAYFQTAIYNLIKVMPPALYNFGLTLRDKKEFVASRKHYEMIMNIAGAVGQDQIDSIIFVNSYLLCIMNSIDGGEIDTAIVNHREYAAVGISNVQAANAIAAKLEGDKSEKLLSFVQEANRIYPLEPSFKKVELNYYLERGETSLALQKAKELTDSDPNNDQLFFIQGVMYDELAKKEKNKILAADTKKKSLKSYQRAIEINPKNAGAQFNLGVNYINEASPFVKEYNALPMNPAKEKYDKLRAEIKSRYTTSLGYFLKAYEASPKDKNYVQTLWDVYEQLYSMYKQPEDKANSAKFKKEFEALDTEKK